MIIIEKFNIRIISHNVYNLNIGEHCPFETVLRLVKNWIYVFKRLISKYLPLEYVLDQNTMQGGNFWNYFS